VTTPVRRGTTNRNARGSATDRRIRKQWLIDTWGDGERVACYRYVRCGAILTMDTITVDRIVPGCQGGGYARTNIRPACAPCNSSTGGATRRAGRSK
jgi:5-methylcytosine-specific restriction endonuclease McrA